MRDFEFSAGWQRQLSPRRGSLGVPAFGLVRNARRAVDKVLETDLRPGLGQCPDVELGQAGLAWLNAEPDATPLGAAVVVVAVLGGGSGRPLKAPFADVWIAGHGLAFAARAVVEMMGLSRLGPGAETVYRIAPGEAQSTMWSSYLLDQTLRVRAALAFAPEPEYARIVAELAAQRSRHVYHRLATSLLAPEQPGWVDEDVADVAAHGNDLYRAVAVTQALTSDGQLQQLDAAYRSSELFRWRITESHAPLATLVDGIGSGVLTELLAWYDSGFANSDRERRLTSMMAQFPSEEAMSALIARADRRYVPPALQEAVDRSPQQGMRLLAEAEPQEAVSEVFRAQVLTRRAEAESVLPQLSLAAAARVQALLEQADSGSGPVATATALAAGKTAASARSAGTPETDGSAQSAGASEAAGVGEAAGAHQSGEIHSVATSNGTGTTETAEATETAGAEQGAGVGKTTGAAASAGATATSGAGRPAGTAETAGTAKTVATADTAGSARAGQETPPALPPLLVSPPWQHRSKADRPKVITGLVCTAQPYADWQAGEHAAFAELPRNYEDLRTPSEKLGSWEERAARLGDIEAYHYDDLAFFIEAPEELARLHLATFTLDQWAERSDLAPLAARFGADAIPVLIRRTTSNPAEVWPVLAPLFSPELAVRTAEWLARLKNGRAAASAWLLRHAAAASLALVPPALGKAGAGRRQAENALALLQRRGEGDAVRAAAQTYGSEAAAAIEELLNRDPLTVLPSTIPGSPNWAAAQLLPPVRTRDGSVLPASAVEHLVTVFALSRIDEPYAGVDVVKEALAPADLAAFVWALFEQWLTAGADPKQSWALDALALAGDDEVVRRLTPLILAWPGEGGHQRAVAGVGVLAAIGSDLALRHLHTIAQRARFKGLKTRAQGKMAEVAQGLGLTAEQLADRLVPDLGLPADGRLRLDYGPRQFVVGFDEQLRPYVTDLEGNRLKALPKPGVKDDDRAAAAYQQFSALRKDARRVAADVVARLEAAMVDERRWSLAEFRQLFVEHPLVGHIVRRLVWARFDEQGLTVAAFRVAENRTFADVSDEELNLADGTVVGVAHPLHLGEDGVAAWAGVFADSEILQPFPQLARTVYPFTAEEIAGGRLLQFEGQKVPSAKLLGLERHGWQRESPMDAGIQGAIGITFATGMSCTVSLDPGIVVGEPSTFGEQTLERVSLDHGRVGSSSGPAYRIAVSEIARDLTRIVGETS